MNGRGREATFYDELHTQTRTDQIFILKYIFHYLYINMHVAAILVFLFLWRMKVKINSTFPMALILNVCTVCMNYCHILLSDLYWILYLFQLLIKSECRGEYLVINMQIQGHMAIITTELFHLFYTACHRTAWLTEAWGHMYQASLSRRGWSMDRMELNSTATLKYILFFTQ